MDCIPAQWENGVTLYADADELFPVQDEYETYEEWLGYWEGLTQAEQQDEARRWLGGLDYEYDEDSGEYIYGDDDE